jgi:hypothetical protein
MKKQQECAPKTVWQMLLFRHDPGGLLQLLNNNINKRNYPTQISTANNEQIIPLWQK